MFYEALPVVKLAGYVVPKSSIYEIYCLTNISRIRVASLLRLAGVRGLFGLCVLVISLCLDHDRFIERHSPFWHDFSHLQAICNRHLNQQESECSAIALLDLLSVCVCRYGRVQLMDIVVPPMTIDHATEVPSLYNWTEELATFRNK